MILCTGHLTVWHSMRCSSTLLIIVTLLAGKYGAVHLVQEDMTGVVSPDI